MLGKLNSFALALFGLSLSIFCAVLFPDFLYLEAWKHLDLQRVILCFGLVAVMFFHAAAFFKKSSLSYESSHLYFFLPFFLVLLGHYFYFDVEAFFPFEGMMFLLYFLVISLSGSFIKRSVGVGDAAVAIVYAAIICCGFYAVFTLQVYIFILNDGLQLKDFIPWGFSNIRFWSHVATWCLPLFPLAVLIGPFKASSFWKASVFLTASIWWWVVILSSAHGTMLAQGAAFVFVILFFGRIAFRWALGFMIQLAGGITLWLMLSWLVPSIISSGSVELPGSVMSTTPIRLLMWEEAYAMSLVNFPFGMGGQSWLMHEPLTGPYVNNDVRLFGAPHNMYLLWAAEYGWISILAIFLPFGYSVYRLKKMCSEMIISYKKNDGITVSVAASVAAILVHSCVSSVLLTAPAMLVGLLVFSLYWAIIIPDSSVSFRMEGGGSSLRSSCKPAPYLRVILGVVLMAMCGVGVIFVKEVMNYYASASNDWECFPQETKLGSMPRFWQHGYFPNRLEYECD